MCAKVLVGLCEFEHQNLVLGNHREATSQRVPNLMSKRRSTLAGRVNHGFGLASLVIESHSTSAGSIMNCSCDHS